MAGAEMFRRMFRFAAFQTYAFLVFLLEGTQFRMFPTLFRRQTVPNFREKFLRHEHAPDFFRRNPR